MSASGEPAAPASRRLRRSVAGGVALTTLLAAGCGFLSEEPKRQPPPCPNASILEGAGVTSTYRPGQEGDAQSLRYTAGLAQLISQCRYPADGLEVDLSFNVLAEKGPAYGQGPLEITYFVATVGPDQRVRSKRLFSTELRFPDGRPVAGQAESLTLRYPFVFAAEGATLQLYLGFQLNPDEVRRRQQRPLP